MIVSLTIIVHRLTFQSDENNLAEHIIHSLVLFDISKESFIDTYQDLASFPQRKRLLIVTVTIFKEYLIVTVTIFKEYLIVTVTIFKNYLIVTIDFSGRGFNSIVDIMKG